MSMEPVDTSGRIDRVTDKKVLAALKAFQKLGGGSAYTDEDLEDVRSHYDSLDDQGKGDLFRDMIDQIEVSGHEAARVLDNLAECKQGGADWAGCLTELRQRLSSPRLDLFRRISHLPGGLRFLLDFRGDLLSLQRFSKTDLKPLDADLVSLIELWFQEGFLYLEEITLDSSYRQIELIKNSDLVHPMTSIEDMGQRLGRDRRCFALYHRLIPYEPVVFIEVALTEGIVKRIADILQGEMEDERSGNIDTAIFYSINNTQNGLAGLGLGKMLIGRVVEYLNAEERGIRQFATLSPIPGFWKNYLKPVLEGEDRPFMLKQKDIPSFFSKKQISRILERQGMKDDRPEGVVSALISLLSNRDWAKDTSLHKHLELPLTRIAYHYIANEKNRQGKALNPVAGFHLGNGAAVTQKNLSFLGNPSERGLMESCGMMVNYIYSSSWLGKIQRSFGWLQRMEMRGIFRKGGL